MESAIVLSSKDNALSTQECSDLAQCEEIIGRGLQSFVDVGLALVKIRDQRLYRQEYPDFNWYCRERWSISRIHAHRCIDAAKVHEMLPIGNKPANEAQARAMTRIRTEEGDLDQKAISRVWRKVVDSAPVDSAGQKVITAKAVEDAAKPVLQRRGIRTRPCGRRHTSSQATITNDDRQAAADGVPTTKQSLSDEQFARLHERVKHLKELMATEWVPEMTRKVIEDVFDIVLGESL